MGSNALRSGAVASLRPHRLLGEYRPWVGVSSLPSSCRRKYLVRCCIYPDTPVWMIVVDNEKQERLVLVMTRPVRGRRQGEWVIQADLDRWACEEGYRFTKQGFDLEGVQARRFTTLQNLVALASLAWGLLAAYRGRAPELIQHARRQKRSTRLLFPFYNLQGGGWQHLFARGQAALYELWRSPPGSEERMSDLFLSSGRLC